MYPNTNNGFPEAFVTQANIKSLSLKRKGNNFFKIPIKIDLVKSETVTEAQRERQRGNKVTKLNCHSTWNNIFRLGLSSRK